MITEPGSTEITRETPCRSSRQDGSHLRPSRPRLGERDRRKTRHPQDLYRCQQAHPLERPGQHLGPVPSRSPPHGDQTTPWLLHQGQRLTAKRESLLIRPLPLLLPTQHQGPTRVAPSGPEPVYRLAATPTVSPWLLSPPIPTFRALSHSRDPAQASSCLLESRRHPISAAGPIASRIAWVVDSSSRRSNSHIRQASQPVTAEVARSAVLRTGSSQAAATRDESRNNKRRTVRPPTRRGTADILR